MDRTNAAPATSDTLLARSAAEWVLQLPAMSVSVKLRRRRLAFVKGKLKLCFSPLDVSIFPNNSALLSVLV